MTGPETSHSMELYSYKALPLPFFQLILWAELDWNHDPIAQMGNLRLLEEIQLTQGHTATDLQR